MKNCPAFALWKGERGRFLFPVFLYPLDTKIHQIPLYRQPESPIAQVCLPDDKHSFLTGTERKKIFPVHKKGFVALPNTAAVLHHCTVLQTVVLAGIGGPDIRQVQ